MRVYIHPHLAHPALLWPCRAIAHPGFSVHRVLLSKYFQVGSAASPGSPDPRIKPHLLCHHCVQSRATCSWAAGPCFYTWTIILPQLSEVFHWCVIRELYLHSVSSERQLLNNALLLKFISPLVRVCGKIMQFLPKRNMSKEEWWGLKRQQELWGGQSWQVRKATSSSQGWRLLS